MKLYWEYQVEISTWGGKTRKAFSNFLAIFTCDKVTTRMYIETRRIETSSARNIPRDENRIEQFTCSNRYRSQGALYFKIITLFPLLARFPVERSILRWANTQVSMTRKGRPVEFSLYRKVDFYQDLYRPELESFSRYAVSIFQTIIKKLTWKIRFFKNKLFSFFKE